MEYKQILTGHIDPKTAYQVENYPYGGKKTTKYYWVESAVNKGDRIVTATVNPKTGELNNTKKTIYSTFMFLFINEENRVKGESLEFNKAKELKEQFRFLLDRIDESNISAIQQRNIRKSYIETFLIEKFYEQRKYAPEDVGPFRIWLQMAREHIQTCPFLEINAYPVQPPFTLPDPDTQSTDKAK